MLILNVLHVYLRVPGVLLVSLLFCEGRDGCQDSSLSESDGKVACKRTCRTGKQYKALLSHWNSLGLSCATNALLTEE